MLFFNQQNDGSIKNNIKIEFSRRMDRKLGLSYLFERVIRLNQTYFSQNPSLLPYTLFHEMTHLWLYDCHRDPSHTQRFYDKMEQFSLTGLPTDNQVHIHKKISKEASKIYACPNCHNRWYLKKELSYPIYCGLCYDKDGIEYYASLNISSKGSSYPNDNF
jgi:predicted SprT family Zn-dependent metalloprotease